MSAPSLPCSDLACSAHDGSTSAPQQRVLPTLQYQRSLLHCCLQPRLSRPARHSQAAAGCSRCRALSQSRRDRAPGPGPAPTGSCATLRTPQPGPQAPNLTEPRRALQSPGPAQPCSTAKRCTRAVTYGPPAGRRPPGGGGCGPAPGRRVWVPGPAGLRLAQSRPPQLWALRRVTVRLPQARQRSTGSHA